MRTDNCRANPCFYLLVALSSFLTTAACGQEWLLRLKLRGREIEGGPVAWNKSQVHMFGRDGRLWSFAPQEAKNFRKTSSRFTSYSQGELRGQLSAEFGKGYEVSGTGHYLVVHPLGQKNRWAYRFEELYRSFVHYFSARGWRPQSPKFPLIAVVFPTQREFMRHANRNGGKTNPKVLGYYSPVTNRIFLYDVTGGRSDEKNWHVNAGTIIHEATHQTAFNLGIHNRTAETPRWVGEGLGTMFEARGVWNSRSYPNQTDRLNRGRLQDFLHYLPQRPKGSLATFVSGDGSFRRDAQAAYAEAWAPTFYLVETRPREYLDYLSTTASVPAFRRYRSQDRLKDFTDAFGSNLNVLEAHYLRYMKQLK